MQRKIPSYPLKPAYQGITRKRLSFYDYWLDGTFKKPVKRVQKVFGSLYEDSSGNFIYNKIAKIRENIDKCGKGKQFGCKNEECNSVHEQYKRIVREYCGYRICANPGCRKKRDKKLERMLEPKLNGFKDARFITLTLRGYHPLSRKPHERLNYAWKRLSLILRKHGYVKAYVKVTEVTAKEYVDIDGSYKDVYFWHLHIVYDGKYLPFSVLQSAWEQYTKDSKWVHISKVKRNISASAYLRKYLAKIVYDSITVEEYYKIYKIKFLSTWACKPEIETQLELSILTMSLKCPYCNMRLLPLENSNAIP